MSYATSSFAEWGRSDFLSDDARAVRLAVEVQDYAGAVRELGPPPASGGVVIQWAPANAGQRADAVAPVLGSTCSVGVYAPLAPLPFWADGLHTLRSLNPASVRLRVLTNASGVFTADTNDAAWSLAWCGFMVQEGGSSSPGRVAEQGVVFRDGLHLLTDRPWLDAAPAWDPADGSGDEERLVDALVRVLKDLEGTSGGPSSLETVVQRWPYVPSDAPGSTVDPMAALRMMRAALWNPDTGDTADKATAVRQIVARVLGRVCQARGGWSIVDPATLADTRGLSVPVHTYDLSAHAPEAALSGAGSGTRTTPDVVQEVFDTSGDAGDGYDLIDSLEDSTGAPVVECVSVYDFAPDLSNVILNGSFEEGTGSSADDWTQSAQAQRSDASADEGASYGDTAWMRMRAVADGSTPEEVSQELSVFVAPVPDAVHTFQAGEVRRLTEDPTSQGDLIAGYDPADGGDPFYFTRLTVTTGTEALPGREAVVILDPPAGDPGTTGYVEGVTLVPEGETLDFIKAGASETAALTLSRPLRVGDVRAYGEFVVSGGTSMPSAGVAAFYALIRSATAEVILRETDTVGDERSLASRVVAYGTSPTGEVAGGYPFVTITGPEDGVDALSDSFIYWDDLSLKVAIGGQAASGTSRRARLTPGRTGYPIALPASGSEDHLLGDGPLPTSRTRLRVEGASGAIVDTSQGEDTAWRNTAWSTDTPDADDADNIDAMLSRDALRLLGAHAGQGGEGRVAFEVQMRPKANGDAPEALWPDRPIRLGLEGRVQLYAPAGSTSLVASYAPTPGEFVVVRRAPQQVTGSEETVTAGTDPATVLTGSMQIPLASGTAGAIYPDARLFCGVLALPVSLAWDVGTGRVAGSALKLAPASETFIEEIILSN